MSGLTPREREVALARIEAIWAESHALTMDWAGTLASFHLLLEWNDLLRLLGEISEGEAKEHDKELRESIAEMIDAANQQEEWAREPTLAQQILSDFADRLAARQGTFMPDFDALYRRKAELDGESHDRPHGR